MAGFRRSTSLHAGVVLCALSIAAAARADALDDLAANVNAICVRHSAQTARLAAAAQATVRAMIAGHSLYLSSEDHAWVADAINRGGGLQAIDDLSRWKPKAGDVVWLAYNGVSYEEDAARIKALEARGAMVVAFGPPLPEGHRPAPLWVDSLSNWSGDRSTTLIANLLSLWETTGELAAAAARQEHTLVFLEGDSAPHAHDRKLLYGGLIFHEGFPRMQPIVPGALAKEYDMDAAAMLHAITHQELDAIGQAGIEMARRTRKGEHVAFIPSGAVINELADRSGEMFRLFDEAGLANPAPPLITETLPGMGLATMPPHEEERTGMDTRRLDKYLNKGGMLVYFGYDHVPPALRLAMSKTRTRTIWIVSPSAYETGLSQERDALIDQHCPVSDAAVDAPGYDIRILPLSGVAQAFIYGLLVKAINGAR